MSSLAIDSPSDLIAYVPNLLGFHPESSMVCVAFGGGPTSRVDLPDSPEEMPDFLDMLCDVYLQHHPTRQVALLAFGDDSRACLEALAALGEALSSDGRGPSIPAMLWVDGDEWLDVLDGTTGTVDPSSRLRMDAEFAGRGQALPTGRRSDLAASLQGDPAPVAALLPAAAQRAARLDMAEIHAETEWFGSRLEVFLTDRKPLSDAEAARVLAALGDGGVRTAAEVRMTCADAAVHTEFWQDLVRRAPEEVKAMPAAMLALSAYLDGHGARAWVALDQITGERPMLANLVENVLDTAVDPRDLERAMRTAAAGTLMQQAALRDRITQARNGHAHENTNRGIDGPASSAPGR